MKSDIAETLIEDYEHGRLSRRQLASQLIGLGAALAAARERKLAKAIQGRGPSRPPGLIMWP